MASRITDIALSPSLQVTKGSLITRHYLKRAMLATGFLVALGRILLLVKSYAVNVFFADQWKFDEATLFGSHSLWQAFRWQHGPHRQGLGAILQICLDPMIRWNSRYEAFGIVLVLSSSAISALLLKRRLLGGLDYWDVAIPFLFLTPVQYEAVLISANPSHGPLPVLLSLLFCLAWVIAEGLPRYALISAIDVLLVYTGFGLLFGLITPLLLGLDFWKNRKAGALVALGFSIAVLASFFLGYRHDTGVTCSLTLHNPLHYGLFAAFMLSTFVGVQPVYHLAPAVITGTALLLVFVLTFVSVLVKGYRNASKVYVVVSILLGYTLLFCFATAYGRICLGLSAAQGSRYMCYLSLGFFGLYLSARAVTERFGGALFTILAVGLVLLSSVGLSTQDWNTMKSLRDGRARWVSCYKSTHDVERCDSKAGFPIFWSPEPPELRTKLDLLEARRLNLFSPDAHGGIAVTRSGDPK